MLFLLFRVALSKGSLAFLEVFQFINLDTGCFFVANFLSSVFICDHFQRDVFSVFDEPLQSFKRKIAHNHRDEPDLCQHITDNLGFVGFGWVQYGVLLEEVA